MTHSPKIKIIKFFLGILIVVFLAILFTTTKVVFFDCKYGQCLVNECVRINQKCEENNYDPKTGQELHNCCSDYEVRAIPLKDRLIKQIIFYSLICGGGLGIALGIFLINKGEKR